MLPLAGNLLEVRLELFERLWPKLEQALASDACAVHDTSAFQYSEMLGDRLSRERRTFCEPRDRLRRSAGQFSNE
jgi:hypothetical protein